MDVQLFKAVLGLVLVTLCPAMLVARHVTPITGRWRLADAIAGAIGGVMSGFGGFAGTVPTLWCTLSGYDKDVQRSMIQSFNLAMLSVTMAIYIGTGIVTSDMIGMFGIVAPAMAIPALIGARVYIGISERAFRNMTLGLLTCSGIALLASSAPVMLGRMAAG